MTRPSSENTLIGSVVLAAIAAGALASAGCGDTDPGEGMITTPDCKAAEGAMLPWKEGNRWTYTVNDEGVVSMKDTTIGALEAVGGTGPHKDVQAHKVITAKGAMDQTISWQAPMGDSVVRYREQSFSASTGDLELEEYWDPYKMHIDGTAEHRVGGVSWLVEYNETKLPVGGTPETRDAHDRWTVLSACESVTVPAGTFTAVYIQKVSGAGGATKTYWYVPGVGKVKESGGQLEELASYSLVP